ncbi:phytanoyl-CoA dioxygenase family protein [Micromonospora sp. NPDC005652]|uniref:phytanoyl-CoA dioxygenase family protein n=1 Tax=Micromonospora sp. NPDC005652 TaxID=3157046 RepID=UPI0034108775
MVTRTVPAGLGFDDHVRRLDVCGFTVIEDALDTDLVRQARSQIEELYRSDPGVAANRSTPTGTYHVENLANKGRIFESFFVSNSLVVKLAERFLGPDYIAQDVWSFGIPPHSPAYRLHSDDDVRTPGTPLSLVTIYPLVDFTADNGGTRVVPGSHWIPRYPDGPNCPGEMNIEAPAGSCVMLFGSLWHSSGANRTNAIRTSMSAYFTVPWIRQELDFSRTLSPEVLRRATPEVRRILGLRDRAPYTERWQWDETTGMPRPEHRATLSASGVGRCCLPDLKVHDGDR